MWLEDLFLHQTTRSGPRGTVQVALDGYGHRWLRVEDGAAAPARQD